MSLLICKGDLAHLRETHKKICCVLPQAAVLALLCVGLITFAPAVFAQQGTFVPTGSMNTTRYGHTTTLLNNGTVLVAGGCNDSLGGCPLASAELYDPATGTFTPTGNMISDRVNYTATLLNNGEVLIAGGGSPGSSLASAELYDPATGTFIPTGTMTNARINHTATLLNNGNVLIAGGEDLSAGNPLLASAELYDPATGTFTATGSMTSARVSDTATLLNNGMVLVAGGVATAAACPGLNSVDLYDPATGTFTATGSMTDNRFGHSATLLDNGKVLVAGGENCELSTGDYVLASSELYDPATEMFTPSGSMTSERGGHTATLLNNGMVLAAGGFTAFGVILASAELYDPATGTFIATGTMTSARSFINTTPLLNNGTALLAGGDSSGGTILASAELYSPVALIPTSQSFSGQPVGTTSASQSVTLTNYQSMALSITSILISGTNASDFSETDNCVGIVATRASCFINVAFTPMATGSRTGNLTVVASLTGGPLALAVALTGAGVAPTQIVSLSASSLTFTNQMVGLTSPAQGIALSNTGNSTLTISGLAFSGTNTSDFAETDNCVGTVAAGASCTINVTFSPMATGTRTGTLSITDNATSPQSPQTVALAGTGVAQIVTVSPPSVTFPNQYVGTSGLPQSVTITNNGSAALNIASVTASPGDFGTLSACGSTLASGASCAVGVFFDPTASGTRTGTLTINDNASGSPQIVALGGTGQDFSVAPSGPAKATITPGQTANYSLAVTPGGGFSQTVMLSCNGAPAHSTCTVSPSSFPLNGSSVASVTVSVTTIAASLGSPTASDRYRFRPLYLISELLVLSVLIASLNWRTGRRPRSAYALALLLFLCAGVMMSGCGGGGSTGGSGGNLGTPAGNYMLTVSATFASGPTSLTHNVNLNLVVQ
jgi:Abnormal spindle-like microcephaly-assoc'd, ASPM-SPD-2-Hydin/Galactose oxidase, central domain/Kelch motif